MGMVGFVISMSTSNVAARYVALFLQAGSYSGFIVLYSWISSSFPRPPAKRAVAIALINAFSQIGSIAGSYVWDLKENGYRRSYGIVFAMMGIALVGCYTIRIMLAHLNKKLEAGDVACERSSDAVSQRPGDEIIKKGFRYLL